MRAKVIYRYALAASITALFATTAFAADDDSIEELTTPTSSVTAGVGYVSKDNQRFGQYNGQDKKGVYGLLDLEFIKRDDATGTWLKIYGRNLGLDHRELRFEHQRQGNWGYFAEFSQLPRNNLYTVSTRLDGIGSAQQTVNAVPIAQDVMLKIERKTVSLGFDKLFAYGLGLQVRFRNEEKEGARLFGQGDNPGNPNTRFLTDPIDYTTRRLEAVVNYVGERLQLSGGYYGTSIDNHIPALHLAGGIFTPTALPPGNRAHQFFLSGGYSFTPTTRATFKVASSRTEQDEAFVSTSVTGRTDLGGKVNTTSLYASLTARPLAKLSLLANFRYEDRDDKTLIDRYFTGVTPTSTLDGNNEPRSITSTAGKLEARYQLPLGFRLTAGMDYELRERNTFRVRSVSHRDETEETSYRIELHRLLSETLTGALSYVRSDRQGSEFLLTLLNNGNLGSNLVHPLHLADRERDKFRLVLNWLPIEPLSLQLTVDEAKDDYSGRVLGPRKGKTQNYSFDTSYTFSSTLQGAVWISRNKLRAEQATQAGSPNGQLWDATLRNRGDSAGISVRGKLYNEVDIGVDCQYTKLKDEYSLLAVSGAPINSLPDISVKLLTLKFFVKHAIKKNWSVRFDYLYDRWNSNDWTWTNWTYSDGTTVSYMPRQRVYVIGVSGSYSWR